MKKENCLSLNMLFMLILYVGIIVSPPFVLQIIYIWRVTSLEL